VLSLILLSIPLAHSTITIGSNVHFYIDGSWVNFSEAHTFTTVYRDATGQWWFDGKTFFQIQGTQGFEPYVDPLSLVGQYFLRGDFIGFFIALFSYAFGEISFFYTMMAFIIGTIIYIRFKSVLICFVFWIICGGAIAALIPTGAVFGILLGVIATGTLLFKLFMSRRNEYA
jgi:hypothetical protein